MTTMNEQSKNDLMSYRKITLWSSCFLVMMLISAALCAYGFDCFLLMNFLIGSLLGTILTIANLFAMGYAFYRVVIKKEPRWALFYPIGSFLMMVGCACGLAIFWMPFLMGFAVGLMTPVLVGAILVYFSAKPA